MRFYLGTHQPAWLARDLGVPLLVSHRRLAGRRTLPRAKGPFAVDSGGFSELSLYGRWRTDERSYVAALRRYATEIGRLEWAAPMDWMTEQHVLARTGLSLRSHQQRTVANYLRLRDLAPELPIIAVLQGDTVTSYHRCADLYERAGVDLAALPLLGVGSICRRQHSAEVEQILRSLAARGYRLHAFGAKVLGLGRYADAISSSDSLAWSFAGRYVSGCTPSHRTESNCLRFALSWHARLLASIRADAPVDGRRPKSRPPSPQHNRTRARDSKTGRARRRSVPAGRPRAGRRFLTQNRSPAALRRSMNGETRMPSTIHTCDESGDGLPRRTAGRNTLAKRLAAKGVRPFCSPRRSSVSTTTPERAAQVRQSVLRAYHAENLATARAASEELVRPGFNTGDVPYGYRAQRVRVRPPGRRPRWRTRLTIEPVEASTGAMIFAWRGTDRLPVREIQRRLAAARYPAPLDPENGQAGEWTVAIVRAILRNPMYLGYQVWGRDHHGRPVPHDRWVWSDRWAHPPVIDPDTFAAAQRTPDTPARDTQSGSGPDSSDRTAV